jgi:branched-chain amino acid transport system substrate-binding protein
LATAGPDTINAVKQAAEFELSKSGIRIVPLQIMLDEVKAIGLQLGQGASALVAFYQDQSPAARAWSQGFFRRMQAMPTQIQAGASFCRPSLPEGG